MDTYRLIVVGGSAGAIAALGMLLPVFDPGYPLPVVIAIHLHPLQDRYFLSYFSERCGLTVKEADEKELIQPGFVYFAPPNYHLLIEDDLTFSLSIDAKVNFSRPSIDVLFESAADAYGPGVIAVSLTGANNDGADGMRRIKEKGGTAVVQDPKTAENSFMPHSVIEATPVDHILPIAGISVLFAEIGNKRRITSPVKNGPVRKDGTNASR